jgi:hypothetical protein
VPEIPVEVRALLPQGLRSPRAVAEFLEEFRKAASLQ